MMAEQEPKVRQFKANRKPQRKRGREGLMIDDKGKIIRDDSWLHPQAEVKPIRK
jgi:hypothetical protein